MKILGLAGLLLSIFCLLPAGAAALTVDGEYYELAARAPGWNSYRVDLTITDPRHQVEVFNQDFSIQDKFNSGDMFIAYNLAQVFGDPADFEIRPSTPNSAWQASSYDFSSTPWPNSVQWTALGNNISLDKFSFEIDLQCALGPPLPLLAWGVHAAADHRLCTMENTDSGLVALNDPLHPIPNPEPATLLLLLSGIIGWAARQGLGRKRP